MWRYNDIKSFDVNKFMKKYVLSDIKYKKVKYNYL